MKTQEFGWADSFTPFRLYVSPRRPGGRPGALGQHTGRGAARESYQKNRINGADEDSPARDIPLDGKCSNWIKCPGKHTLPRPQADGTYKEGWEEEDYDNYYRIRYQEGPGDKAWMEERDGNYLARLEREGQVEKAAELRASLPASHPHYRALTLVVPAPSPQTRRATPHLSGQGAGAGAAASGSTPPITSLHPAAGAGMAEPSP